MTEALSMFRLLRRFWSWPVLMGMTCSALLQPVHAAPSIADPAAFLDQTESLRTKDHPRFVQMLAQIRSEAPSLTPEQQWHLRYLDGWETTFEGNYAKAQVELRDVIDHADNPTLVAKASALLLTNLAASRHYDEAFALANRVTVELPRIKDPMARYLLLMNLSQMLDLAGQTDIAIKYAHMMADATPPGESQCLPATMEVAALYNGKRLTSSSPQLQHGIETCTAARQPVATNAMMLVLSNLYLDENQPAKAMALLDRIAPSVRINHYFDQMLSAQTQRAQAYAKLGNDDEARKAALAAVAMDDSSDISEWMRDAYEVLYQVEKRAGHSAAALAYYERYVTEDKGYLNDISARTLAYDSLQQRSLVQKLQTESLSRQNSILRLKQALAIKAIESSRLYIALLLLVLISIMFLLLRLKRSQLRFKHLARLDGLTGIFNHQHFISEADQALRLLEKKSGTACLAFLDLDHFKQVNDTHGHAVGDEVLKRVVTICQQHLRQTDLFGRLGGEEFGILLPDCSRDRGLAVADRIRLTIEATRFDGDGYTIAFSASVGLVCTEISGYELQRLCREADAALYRAKRSGRNRVIADSGGDHLAEA
jgi:diguanylate cyclase (GGDEF)-like protein